MSGPFDDDPPGLCSRPPRPLAGPGGGGGGMDPPNTGGGGGGIAPLREYVMLISGQIATVSGIEHYPEAVVAVGPRNLQQCYSLAIGLFPVPFAPCALTPMDPVRIPQIPKSPDRL